MDFMEVLKKRYSCKKFDGRKIRKEQLDAILEAGRLAPTDKNLQEQKIYVVQSDEGLEKIDRITPCRYGAGTVLLVAFDRENVFVYPGGKRDSGVEDATIVATHMLLAAKAAGVESCWINFFDPEAAASSMFSMQHQIDAKSLRELNELGWSNGSRILKKGSIRHPAL